MRCCWALRRAVAAAGMPHLPELVPVSGTVTLDGKPLSGATVTFLPVGATRGRSCYGVTGADGRYELMETDKNKGAPEGEFEVLCNKWVMPDGSDLPTRQPGVAD